jgi:hypothetical protein
MTDPVELAAVARERLMENSKEELIELYAKALIVSHRATKSSLDCINQLAAALQRIQELETTIKARDAEIAALQGRP